MKYRLLRVGEAVRAGDVCRESEQTPWKPVEASIGTRIDKESVRLFGRPTPDAKPLKVDYKRIARNSAKAAEVIGKMCHHKPRGWREAVAGLAINIEMWYHEGVKREKGKK